MPALDAYHVHVRDALVKDGWTITHDPLVLPAGKRNVFVDLGAERLLAAERGNEKIAVEIKTFSGKSDMASFEMALGQFFIYLTAINIADPDRELFLALPQDFFSEFMEDPFIQRVRSDYRLKIFTFDPDQAQIVQWID